VGFKTGNSKLYSILQVGMNTNDSSKVYAFGYGLGSELPLNKKKSLALNPELVTVNLYRGSWDYHNILTKLQVNLTFNLGKYISFFAGPSFNVFFTDQTTAVSGYKSTIPPSSYKTIDFSNKVKGWFAWNAGISFF
ncbi:MAG TPA: hypothetical protein VHM26_11210, partial [Chitinophagaceae bacterium]|nr:hypothetical protein [Chitinophagaceae bacterium]